MLRSQSLRRRSDLIVKVVVVGSGLAAVGALKGLIGQGIRPVVLDVGKQLDRDKQSLKIRLSTKQPHEWSESERREVAENNTKYSRKSSPRKLVMGSDYFYSSDSDVALGASDFAPTSPPYSLALGGFSAGWGAAYLPPAECDMDDWPVSRNKIIEHMEICAQDIPCSEPTDSLTPHFPRLKENVGTTLHLSSGQSRLLKLLKLGVQSSPEEPELVGQSRLMTRTNGEDSKLGCQYCGQCNSGCVYDCIYGADLDISRMRIDSLIDYRANRIVLSVEETGELVKIKYLNGATGEVEIEEADFLYLAAGAVNSTRIAMQSIGMIGHSVSMSRTGGFIQPFVSLNSFPTDWPDNNTQSAIFLEFKELNASKHWIHTQISQTSDLLLAQLGVGYSNAKTIRGRGTELIARHLAVALLNMHSDHGPKYIVKLQSDAEKDQFAFESRQELTRESAIATNLAHSRLKKILRRSKMLSLGILRKDSLSAFSYHFGCSFPMRSNPTQPTDTDVFGRPFGWKRIHLVDTSVLPSIPATTVGMLTMANAHRIASKALDNS